MPIRLKRKIIYIIYLMTGRIKLRIKCLEIKDYMKANALFIQKLINIQNNLSIISVLSKDSININKISWNIHI